MRGGISAQKTDSNLGTVTPYGDASFENIVFNVINDSAASVIVESVSYVPGEVVTQITTDSSGFATTGSGVLPYGQYLVTEESASDDCGYAVNVDYRSTVSVTADQVFSADACGNLPNLYGGVSLYKVDKATGTGSAQGDASLEGAAFEIINRSANAITVKGRITESMKQLRR